MDAFKALKKDADSRGMKNMSMCYKRVIMALGKYPMPILCAEQAKTLEGVGDQVAMKFQDLITEREKQFEDQVFL